MTRSIRLKVRRYSPSSEGKGQGFFLIVGGSHQIYAGRRNQTKVEGPFDSLRGIAAPSPGAIPGPSSRRAGHSSLFELLPRTQTGRSQLSWTGQRSSWDRGGSLNRSFLGFLITSRTEIFPLIEREGFPLEQTLKGYLPASTEEVYFVPPGGHIDQNPEQ
ncbi:LOW QUALITY PROTEIN: hypothetical protein RJ641_011891 [Dillenia turbinata]|uniref:Uncharacterized protein n=1 Tax=Dillenia turbinata TaxID=194707 RepID=A0AAN8V6E9_9MAGN